MNEKEMAASVMRTAKQTHRSNLALVNAAVEQTTRAKGMKTAMASFVGLEEDQFGDAKEKHEDGMPTYAWLEVEKLENPGDPYYDPDYGPEQLYGPYPYEAVYGVDEQCWGVREEGDKEQRDEEVNFTKEDLRSVEKILAGEAQEALRRVIWRDYAGDLNLYTIPQHERELIYISALLLRWYRNTAEHEREQVGGDKW
jgi:hypothetical protein